jgi:hypothetical protein
LVSAPNSPTKERPPHFSSVAVDQLDFPSLKTAQMLT